VQTALDGYVENGEIFFLLPLEDGYLIEFRGSMAGEGQDLLEVEEDHILMILV
jgi:hypothetical protein